MHPFKIYVLPLLIFCSNKANAQSRTNFLVSRFELCPADNPIIKFSGNISTEGRKQYMDFDCTLPFSLGKNVGVSCFIQHALDGTRFFPLFTIREKDICKATNKYLGEYFHAMQRAAQMAPGVCPMQVGRYRLHHFLLPYDRIALQTFPFGKLRFTIKVIDNRRNTSIACFFSEMENQFN